MNCNFVKTSIPVVICDTDILQVMLVTVIHPPGLWRE